MASERMVKKAQRLLTAGKVHLIYVDGTAGARTQTIVAVVEGDNATYQVWRDPGDRIRCDCPSLKWRCSHVIAVELVTGKAPSGGS